MRKLFLLGFLAVSCLFVSAQDGLQGTWFVGGNVNLNSNKGYEAIDDVLYEVKTKDYGIMPLVGTFVSPNVAIGAAIGYNHIKEGEKRYEAKTNVFTVMPLVRKYWNLTGSLYFFGQASLPVQFGNYKEPITGAGDYKENFWGIHAELSPGFDWIVNSWFSVEASFVLVNAGYSSSKPKGGDSTSSWGVNGNTVGTSKFGDINVGVKFLF